MSNRIDKILESWKPGTTCSVWSLIEKATGDIKEVSYDKGELASERKHRDKGYLESRYVLRKIKAVKAQDPGRVFVTKDLGKFSLKYLKEIKTSSSRKRGNNKSPEEGQQ